MQCHNKFASEPALAAHAQRADGYRTEWSKRVDDSGVCPVCIATFHTRIRALHYVRSSAPPAGTDAMLQPARKSATSHDGKMRPGEIARL